MSHHRTLLALVSTVVAAGASQAASDYWRIKVAVPDGLTLQRLLDSGADVLDCCPHIGHAHVVTTPDEAALLRLAGFRFEFVNTMPDPRNWARFYEHVPADYRSTYFNADQILAHFEGLRAQYPAFVTRSQIGTSINSEPVWVYRIGRPLKISGTPENAVIVLGLTHAREWVSGSVVMHVATMSAQTLATPQAVPFMTNQALYIVPMLNPDGYRFSWTNNRYWRKNRRNNGGGSFGVDLNRNYAKGWGGAGSSGNPNSETYRGTAPFSEPETAGLRDFTLSLPRVGAVIDFHNYSQKILWPWSYTTAAPPDRQTLSATAAAIEARMDAFGANYDHGQGSVALYVAGGTSKDWFYDVKGSRSYTIELRDTGTYGFELPPSQIRPTQDEAWAGVVEMLKIIGP
jgi:murein tripeptide amidase MpaA